MPALWSRPGCLFTGPPGKLAPPIEAQVVRCVNVKCARDFPVLNTEEIVDGPYEV